MLSQVRFSVAIAAIAGTTIVSAAFAQPVISASYNNLAGSWSPGNDFTAVAAAGGSTNSSMFVQRILAPASTATFTPGFVAGVDQSNFVMNISVTGIGANTASGSGSFTLTDFDGDVISGTISGISTGFGAALPGWQYINPTTGQIRFNGTLSNVNLIASGDGIFEGNLGSWNMGDLLGANPYSGSITALTFDITGGPNFFVNGFSNNSTGGSFQLVPTPGSLALLGLAGAAAARRRRN